MNEPTKISDAAKAIIIKATQFALKRNGGKQGGWAARQQLDAQMFVMADDAGAEPTSYDGTPHQEAMRFFGNASANAQYLEKNGVIDKRTSRVAKRENIFAGFSA